MIRSLTPEILDSLPYHHADAIASRRDLACINKIMQNTSWLVDQVLRMQAILKINQWVELGAGDGNVGHYLKQIQKRKECHVIGLDLVPRPDQWPQSWDWHQGNLWDWHESCHQTRCQSQCESGIS